MAGMVRYAILHLLLTHMTRELNKRAAKNQGECQNIDPVVAFESGADDLSCRKLVGQSPMTGRYSKAIPNNLITIAEKVLPLAPQNLETGVMIDDPKIKRKWRSIYIGFKRSGNTVQHQQHSGLFP